MPVAVERCRDPGLGSHIIGMRCRRGFTLIEIIVAAFLFAVGVLALEATAVAALRGMRRSATVALVASVARARLERLAASRCADAIGGVDTTGAVISAWTVGPAAQGAATRGVTQTLTYQLDGAPRTLTLRSTFPCTR